MSKEIPEIIKVLEGRIDSWKYIGEIISIAPKVADLDEMYFFQKGLLWSMDKKSIFIGMVNIVPDQINSDMKKLYQKLKGMECELESGFMQRNIHFKYHSDLVALKRRIPNLILNDRIIRRLNEDKSLLSIVKKVRPEKLTLTLSMPTEIPISTREDYYEAVAKYYEDPLKITWEAALTKVVERGLGYRMTINGIFDTMEKTSKILKEVSTL